MANAPSQQHMATAAKFADAEVAPRKEAALKRMPKGLTHENLMAFAGTPAGKAMIQGMRRKAKGK